jgi:hypothetical protein
MSVDRRGRAMRDVTWPALTLTIGVALGLLAGGAIQARTDAALYPPVNSSSYLGTAGEYREYDRCEKIGDRPCPPRSAR